MMNLPELAQRVEVTMNYDGLNEQKPIHTRKRDLKQAAKDGCNNFIVPVNDRPPEPPTPSFKKFININTFVKNRNSSATKAGKNPIPSKLT